MWCSMERKKLKKDMTMPEARVTRALAIISVSFLSFFDGLSIFADV